MNRLTNVMIGFGLVLVILAPANLWLEYRRQHLPIDMVNTSAEELDRSDTFIPLVQPVATDNLTTASVGGASKSDIGQETSTSQGFIPDRLVIPAIELDAPIVPIHYTQYGLYDKFYYQWNVPNTFAAGWHDSSALLGVAGNTVLNGHHNAFGKVFADLIRLEPGDLIQVYSGEHVFEYRVATKMLLPERFQSIDTRMENARWIMPSDDERLTLVTCWPATSNTHRVVVVALPVE